MSLSIANCVNLRHLRAFSAVARMGTFTRAAEQLCISQPALTTCIRQLEDYLGIPLFERTTRRVDLTPAGEHFLPSAEQIIRDLEAAIRSVSAVAAGSRGHVSVATISTVATGFLPSVIAEFMRAAPDVSINLSEDNSEGVRRRVNDGDADFGLAGISDEHPELTETVLFKDKLGIFCRSDHPLAQSGGPIRWAELQGHALLNLGYEHLIKAAMHLDPDLKLEIPRVRHSFRNAATVIEVLESGPAVAVLPEMSFTVSQSNCLRFIELVEPQYDRTVFYVTRTGEELSASANSLLEVARRRARTLHPIRVLSAESKWSSFSVPDFALS